MNSIIHTPEVTFIQTLLSFCRDGFVIKELTNMPLNKETKLNQT